MKCNLCKINEATNHTKKIHICNKCWIDIQLGFSYYIGGKEYTYEEFKRKIDRGEV